MSNVSHSSSGCAIGQGSTSVNVSLFNDSGHVLEASILQLYFNFNPNHEVLVNQ
jgi:hypothetical protein